MTTFLNRELQRRAGKIRYNSTEAGVKHDQGKHVLMGKNQQGQSVEIPTEDVMANEALVAKGNEKDGFTRMGSYEMLEETPIPEGGMFRMPPPQVAMAGIKALSNPEAMPFNLYPKDDVNLEYIDYITEFFKQKFKMEDISTSNVALGYGTYDLVNGLLSVMMGGDADNRDIILGQENEYHGYARVADRWDGEIEFIKELSEDSLRAWFDNNPDKADRAEVLFFSNPSATSGKVYSKEELEGIARVAEEKNLFVIVDQIFATSVFEPEETEFMTFANLPDMAERTATLWGPSKDWGAANMRQGYVVAPEEVIQHMYLHSQYGYVTISKVLQEMGKELLEMALEENPPWLQENVAELKERRDLMMEKIDSINDNLHEKLSQSNPTAYQELLDFYAERGEGNGVKDEEKSESSRPFDFLKVAYKPEASHTMIVDFDEVLAVDMYNRQGELVKDNVDVTGYMLEYGLPTSPLSSTGNESSQVRFSYSQFGQEATMPVYLRELIELQAEWMNESFNANINLEGTQEELEKFAKTQGLELDPRYKDITTYAEAFEVGKERLSETLDQMGKALEDLVESQDVWRERRFAAMQKNTGNVRS